MVAIALSKEDNIPISSKFQSLKYGLIGPASLYSPSFIKSQSEKIYNDLYQEIGDSLYEFLYQFIKESNKFGK